LQTPEQQSTSAQQLSFFGRHTAQTTSVLQSLSEQSIAVSQSLSMPSPQHQRFDGFPLSWLGQSLGQFAQSSPQVKIPS
jgi:hypothetical protein